MVPKHVYEVDQELGGEDLSLLVCVPLGWGIDLQERKTK